MSRKQISVLGMASQAQIDQWRKLRGKRLSYLEALGLTIRNGGASAYFNKISPACVDCSGGAGLTVNLTTECNRKCYFCFYRGPHREKMKLIDVIKNIYTFRHHILSFAISGGECLLELDATVKALEFAKIISHGACQTRIYTNGDLVDRHSLEKLRTVGLDEIRISIKPGNRVIEKITLAKAYIPRVMVETPVFPDEEEKMKGILSELNALDIFGVNLLEFVFCCQNAHEYAKRGYKVTTDRLNEFSQPYPYDYPVHGSESACLNLLEFSAKERFSIGVHYCSLKNKRNSRTSVTPHGIAKGVN